MSSDGLMLTATISVRHWLIHGCPTPDRLTVHCTTLPHRPARVSEIVTRAECGKEFASMEPASNAELPQMVVVVFVDEHTVKSAGYAAKGRMRRPFAMRTAVRGEVQLLPGRFHITSPVPGHSREHFRCCLRLALRERNDVREQPPR